MSSFIELNISDKSQITINTKSIITIIPYKEEKGCIIRTSIDQICVKESYKEIKKKIREAGGHFV